MWADYVSDGYLPANLPIRDLTNFEWTHHVLHVDADLVWVLRPLHGGGAISLGSAALRRDALREGFREKLFLLLYSMSTLLEMIQ